MPKVARTVGATNSSAIARIQRDNPLKFHHTSSTHAMGNEGIALPAPFITTGASRQAPLPTASPPRSRVDEKGKLHQTDAPDRKPATG